MTTDNIPAAPNPRRFLPDQITLYGVALNLESTDRAANLPFEGHFVRLSIVPIGSDAPTDPEVMVIAAIYGYAFEGHCYRLDKPKLLVFRPGVAEVPAVGCGFEDLGYSMWQITSKTPVMEFATSTDLAEEIVLNSNLPGNRNPNTYGNSFMLGHRSGRLNRGGGNGG
ncbi:hypothetical protein OCK02_21850 [Rhizobium sp. TRM96647]|uniref:hypothetical protein n=1 Tax=unclassified Rhizobium TaxID=2613769 RepID=UPI0021E96B33|nr:MULTISPECIES: hypothetical protein [unclassified Rhizobium]MCV3738833.1 hypothetical protein [Rhizobium sp. TRM96647]MCV3760460.1 hypothetical protein [Rhizobium sp. TRM96650]